MNPYARPEEKAAAKTVEQSYRPKKLIGQAANLAGIVGGSALLTRIMPFLSKLIPSSLAAKGLSKVSPGLNKFFKGITSTGYTIDDGLNYLRNQVMPEDNEKEIDEDQLKAFNDYQNRTKQINPGQTLTQPQQPQQPGQGQQALMAALQKLQQIRGGG